MRWLFSWLIFCLVLNLIEESIVDLVYGDWWFGQSNQKISSPNHILVLALSLDLVSSLFGQPIPLLFVCLHARSYHTFHLFQKHLLVLLVDSSIFNIERYVKRFTLFCISAHICVFGLVINIFLKFAKGLPRESFPKIRYLFSILFFFLVMRFGGNELLYFVSNMRKLILGIIFLLLVRTQLRHVPSIDIIKLDIIKRGNQACGGQWQKMINAVTL